MKKDKSPLENLQDLRDDNHNIQRKIDDYFLKDSPKQRRKKKRKINIKDPDDLWW
jgi:hypothetical protein